MKYFYLGIFLLLLFLLGCTQPTTSPTENNSAEIILNNNTSITNNTSVVIKKQITIDDCFNGSNVTSCLSNFTYKDCFNSNYKEPCIRFFADQDPSLCQYSSNVSDCYLSTYSCNDFLCVAIITNNSSFCDYANDKESCIVSYVKTTGVDACNFEDELKQSACRSLIKNDYCKDLIDGKKDKCYQYLAYFENNVGYCYLIDSTLYSLPCIEYFAIESKDPSLCDHFSLDEKWKCIINYSVEANDYQCDLIDPLAKINRFNCIWNFATINSRPDICKELSSMEYRTMCYTSILFGEGYLDPTYCKELEEGWREKCYEQAAIRNKDPSLCDHAMDKQSCLDKIEG